MWKIEEQFFKPNYNYVSCVMWVKQEADFANVFNIFNWEVTKRTITVS